MPKLRDLRPVDADYASTGPNHRVLTREIPASAETLFRSFEDAASWKAWLDIDVEWTSPPPFGVGTTRTVTARGQRIDEHFLAWEEGRRMCFRFERTTLPLDAFAEDYLIEPTGPSSCVLRWHTAFEWGGPLPPVFGRGFGAVFAMNGRRALGRLATHVAGLDPV